MFYQGYRMLQSEVNEWCLKCSCFKTILMFNYKSKISRIWTILEDCAIEKTFLIFSKIDIYSRWKWRSTLQMVLWDPFNLLLIIVKSLNITSSTILDFSWQPRHYTMVLRSNPSSTKIYIEFKDQSMAFNKWKLIMKPK